MIEGCQTTENNQKLEIEVSKSQIIIDLSLYFLLFFRLKSALMALGLKCGGTLEERANRLFSTKGKSLNDLDPALFAKSKGKASTAHRSAKELEKHREIAAMEAQVYRFAEILSEQRAATKENVERKQARTELEREDSDDEESGNFQI